MTHCHVTDVQVQTYHIETFPVNDHDPLPCKKLVPEDERVDDEAAESSGDEEHSNSGSQAARAEILETWVSVGSSASTGC